MCTGNLVGVEGIGACLVSRVDDETTVDCWLAWSKMRSNFWIAWSWILPIWEKGVDMGLASALVRARAVLTAASAEELLGTG